MNAAPLGFGDSDDSEGSTATNKAIMESVKNYFRPEFLNRVDEVVMFEELNESDLVQILDLEVSKLEKRVNGIELAIHIDEDAKRILVREGATPDTGARGLRRVLEDRLQDKIADLILDGKLPHGGTVKVTLDDEKKLNIVVDEKDPVRQTEQ